MNAIQKYFKYRQSLIDQYAKGDMTKREYLQRNYEAVIYGDIGPFRNMDTLEKALFNYQYYNALAKEMKTVSTTRDMDYELKRDYMEKSNYYYSKKDKATLTALRMLDYKGWKPILSRFAVNSSRESSLRSSLRKKASSFTPPVHSY